jgi:NAD dependent epimerase/dehydratase family enzyme
MYYESIENNYLNGNYNAVAPEPVSQKDLIMMLGQKIRNKFFIPVYVPAFGLKLAFGKRSIELLKSATVSNKKIKATGFTFLFPSIESAIDDLVKRTKK